MPTRLGELLAVLLDELRQDIVTPHVDRSDPGEVVEARRGPDRTSVASTPSQLANSSWNPIATLHSPIAR